jgi:hypothetical protein
MVDEEDIELVRTGLARRRGRHGVAERTPPRERRVARGRERLAGRRVPRAGGGPRILRDQLQAVYIKDRRIGRTQFSEVFAPLFSRPSSNKALKVEVRGFEPLTPAVRRQCSTGLSYTPGTAPG